MRLSLALSLLAVAGAARILCVYPAPSFSHQIVFRYLTKELARRGHELVVITTDPYLPKVRPADNVKEIDLHDLSYGMIKDSIKILSSESKSPMDAVHNVILKKMAEVFAAQLETPELRELIHNKTETFDLVIVDAVIRIAFFYTHRFKAPVIGFSTSMGMQFNYDSTGTPSHPLLYPDMFQKNRGKLTFWEKVDALYTDLWQRYAYWRSAAEENRIGKKYFGEDTPDIQKLVNNIDLLFLNVNPIWDGIRPVPPSVIYVDGFHINPPNKLPSDLKSYLDGCTQGVVYMSLGSNIKSAALPADRVQIFLLAFRELEYCVLWKWEADELPGRPDNVRLAKWLPQSDILRHPNIRAFITQCGLQSTDEAIEAEVPLVGIPFMCDQGKNANTYVFHGIGVALDIKTLSKEVLTTAIHNVTRDKSYRVSISRLKRLMRDQPLGGLERAVWWVEYLLRHGTAAHLRSPSAAASLLDYWPLDVLAALLLTAALAAAALRASLRYCHRRLRLRSTATATANTVANGSGVGNLNGKAKTA